MRYLLDTQILIWSIRTPQKLSSLITALLENENNALFISIVSLWEIAIKLSNKKLDLDVSYIDYINASQITLLGIEPHHLKTLLTLPYHHKDPFDRLLVAQAIIENLTIITSDQQLQPYDAKIILA